MSIQDSTAPITFTDPEVRACPFPHYDRLREEQPVYRDPKSGHYVLTRYDDVRKALLNFNALSNKAGFTGDKWGPEARRILETEGWAPMDTLVSNDPPGHRTYRTLVDKVFTTQKVTSLEPRIAEIIDELISKFEDRSEIDFLQDFAVPLPVYVIAEQLGIAPSDQPKFKRWSDAVVESVAPNLTSEHQCRLAREVLEMQHYLAHAIERVRKTPDDRLISRLVNLDTDGRTLDMCELQSIIMQVLVAGNETTTTTLAHGMKSLIERPDLAEAIHRDPGLASKFAEETLRINAPIQTLFRRALVDVEIGGTTVPAGSIVEVRYGAANRDPKQYACPADVDLTRANSGSHLTFGSGIHLCVGNQLARGELRLAFQALTRRLTGFRFARGNDSVQWLQSYAAYGPKQLWMNFDKRAASPAQPQMET